MPEIVSNGLTLHYDTFGDSRDPAVLLVMGLGTQMIAWRTEFCESLASLGLHVIRFDNRDVGLSTKIHGAPLPSIPRTLMLRPWGFARSAYTLSDMARDAVGVLDGLSIRAAHVVGVSMGGMIAQTLAIEHRSRTLSLTSVMSSPGDYRLPPPTHAARTMLLRPAPRSREQAIDQVVALFRVIGSPKYFDEARVRERAGESYDRSSYRLGTARQLDAILASRPRSPALRELRIAATIVHGALDPLVPIAHGLATAKAIPGADLHVIDDLAHDLPEPKWPELVRAISRTIERAA
ncbi:alpha/beta fold hydrolase [Sandaracinus amylolyticus]|uniref:alpha/beta fold hydrolase n=1 Tax=Sandaracinus amylolyticus TaxID=927083 RepID=UPI001F42911D|nr:alpha/beta hydrolase [Sandaracinus amylolyticus]UJR80848.1 Pimeloyl-ACP methyl ester carboxylesterase [Sandaracinus amylolyticus]